MFGDVHRTLGTIEIHGQIGTSTREVLTDLAPFLKRVTSGLTSTATASISSFVPRREQPRLAQFLERDHKQETAGVTNVNFLMNALVLH